MSIPEHCAVTTPVQTPHMLHSDTTERESSMQQPRPTPSQVGLRPRPICLPQTAVHCTSSKKSSLGFEFNGSVLQPLYVVPQSGLTERSPPFFLGPTFPAHIPLKQLGRRQRSETSTSSLRPHRHGAPTRSSYKIKTKTKNKVSEGIA